MLSVELHHLLYCYYLLFISTSIIIIFIIHKVCKWCILYKLQQLKTRNVLHLYYSKLVHLEIHQKKSYNKFLSRFWMNDQFELFKKHTICIRVVKSWLVFGICRTIDLMNKINHWILKSFLSFGSIFWMYIETNNCW